MSSKAICEKAVCEKISSDPATGSNGINSDPEALERVPSGPQYSVFSGNTKRFIVTMVAIGGIVSPMTANIYFPALNPIAKDLGISISLINLTLTTVCQTTLFIFPFGLHGRPRWLKEERPR